MSNPAAFTAAQGLAWRTKNYQWSQIACGLEDANALVDAFTCPEDFSGVVKTSCALAKNVLFVATFAAWVVMARVRINYYLFL
jgi:hypothetical protein